MPFHLFAKFFYRVCFKKVYFSAFLPRYLKKNLKFESLKKSSLITQPPWTVSPNPPANTYYKKMMVKSPKFLCPERNAHIRMLNFPQSHHPLFSTLLLHYFFRSSFLSFTLSFFLFAMSGLRERVN